MPQLNAIANTLFVPLVARISVSKEFPEYFYDEKALALEAILPPGAEKGASQYSNMASAARYYTMDQMVETFFCTHSPCNVVYLGAGLETAFNRLSQKAYGKMVNWFEVDLPEVIEVRKKILGEGAHERLIAGDMFQMQWLRELDAALPTLLVVSGVFQYFHEAEIIKFLKNCKNRLPKGELIFDATSESGLRFTNWFIKRTGNRNALMYFYVNDSNLFAQKCGALLLAEKTFFPDALRMLKKKLRLLTKISMKVAESRKQVLILHLRLNP